METVFSLEFSLLDLGLTEQSGFKVSLELLGLLPRNPLAINFTTHPATHLVALALVLGITYSV